MFVSGGTKIVLTAPMAAIVARRRDCRPALRRGRIPHSPPTGARSPSAALADSTSLRPAVERPVYWRRELGVGPSWSPDGRRIAVLEASDVTNHVEGRLWVVGADGSGRTQLSSGESPRGGQVAWAPDGSTIAFGDSRGGISTVRPDGSARRVLVPYNGLPASDPAWSPDGKRLAFAGEIGEICVVNANGTGRGRLTYSAWPSPGRPTDPAWQPQPAGSAPAGAPVAPSGPPASWDRNRPWYTACVWQQYPGKTLTGRVDRVRATVGAVVTYRFRLANRGVVPIGDDAMASFGAMLDGGAHVLSVAVSRGKCVVDDPLERMLCQHSALSAASARSSPVSTRT